MSSAPDPHLEQLQQRYAAIEQLYAQQNWPAVEAGSQGLLADLGDRPGDPLRPRLLLLLAHTQLYGNGDPVAAASLYAAVLAAEPEAVLAEMAEQGLGRCGQPEQPDQPDQPDLPEVGTEGSQIASDVAALAQAAATALEGAADTAADEPAMPWLQDLDSEGARRPLSVESDLALAPFQLPVTAAEAAEPLEPGEPGAGSERTAATEEPFKPLRWPFMADYVERPPAEPSPPAPQAVTQASEGAGGLETALDLAGAEAEAEAGIEAADVAEPAAVGARPLPQPELEIEVLKQGRFSLEEIQELSTGLLRITLPTGRPPVDAATLR